ncbi:MAG TPA: amidohydrolase family protein, partial [Terriglobales bacterium]|nr:amidohydrolase family protein [Terriglobales bacterium]
RYLPPALRGQRLDLPLVVDAHVHIGRFPTMYMPWPGWDRVLAVMDRIGIHRAAVNGILYPDFVEGNDLVAALYQQYPERVIGIMGLNPFYGGRALLDEMTRCADQLGFRGIKLHELVKARGFASSFNPSMLDPILEFAECRQCPILYHGLITERMIGDHPRVTFICAHGPAYIDVVLAMSRYENFHVDTAYTIVLRGTIERFVDQLGSHRVLFGSDAPLSAPSVRLAQILAAAIPDDAVENILGRNAARIYRL